MKNTDLLKIILPGLLPLLVFILADEIWGTTIGLYVAVGFGIVQLVAIYLKEKRLDKFVLFDILLIIAMGAISIILDNDVFFKLKPGIIGVIIVAFLGISAYSPKNLLMTMSARYMKGVEFNSQLQMAMQKNMRILFWLFAAHTVLVFYSAFLMSKQAWVFISGGLFYIIFAVFFAVGLVRRIVLRRKSKTEEILSEIDKDGKVIGTMTRSEAHNGSKRLHPVIHVHIFNNYGNLLLQKRSLSKKIQPGKWDTAVGGHIAHGEKIEIALERESFEELGIRKVNFQFITKYVWNSDIESELVFVFAGTISDFSFVPNDEVIEAKFWSKEEIRANFAKNVFTPNFESEYKAIVCKIEIKLK
jgi:isopentenyl-diphosphate delta-isomerase type 1